MKKKACVWLVALAIFAVLAGCKSKNSSSPESLTAKISTAAGSMMSGSDALKRSWDAVKQAKSFRAHMESSANGESSNIDMEVSCPDREHTVMHHGDQSFESIHIGDASYTRIAGRWMKMPSTREGLAMCGGGQVSKDMPNPYEEIDKANITPGSMDMVNGSPCQEYNVTPAQQDASQPPRSFQVCVGVTDHLPRQVKSEDMTMTYKDWNQPVEINPPM